MRINNIDTLTYKTTLLDRDIENSETITYDDWLDDGFSPINHKQVHKFSMVTCEFLVQASSDDEAEELISDLLKLSSQAELKFEDMTRTYKGVVDSSSKSKITTGQYDLQIAWKCEYSFGEEKLVNINTASSSITVKGNEKTPVIIEINPSTNRANLAINGLGEDIVIHNLIAGKSIIIDSEKAKVTEDGVNKFNDYHSWGYPYFSPGQNIITLSAAIPMTIRYKPRWI